MFWFQVLPEIVVNFIKNILRIYFISFLEILQNCADAIPTSRYTTPWKFQTKTHVGKSKNINIRKFLNSLLP